MQTHEILDAAYDKAVSSRHFKTLPEAEKMAILSEMAATRAAVADGELVIPAAICNALSRYSKESWRSRISKKAAIGGGIAVLSVAGAVALPMSHATAPVAAKTTISATKANAALPHAKPIKGMCAADFVLAKARYKHTVKTTTGGKMALKKGALVCIEVAAGSTGGNNGTVRSTTGVPANFPSNPSVADVQSLGWGPDTQVPRSVWDGPNPTLKRPASPAASAAKPASVTINRAVAPQVTDDGSGTVRISYEVTISGGSGVVQDSTGAYHALGKGPVTMKVVDYSDALPGGQASAGSNILVMDDYGQAYVPKDVAEAWSGDGLSVQSQGGVVNIASGSWL